LSFPDSESLPQNDSDTIEVEIVDTDEELETSNADEEMSGGLESDDADDILVEALEDESEEDPLETEAEDAEKAELRARVAEYEAQVRRAEYEKQQQNNQQYWAGIQGQAEQAFAWEFDQIFVQKDNQVDPDLYVRTETAKLQRRVADWFQRFHASQNEARRQQYERAAIPTYAARLATNYDLSVEQAQELLDYAPERMDYEAQKMARYNAREAAYRKKLQQSRRADGQANLLRKGSGTTGSGRAPVKRVKRGSDEHLTTLLAAAGGMP
jgi:hypothetical protein